MLEGEPLGEVEDDVDGTKEGVDVGSAEGEALESIVG